MSPAAENVIRRLDAARQKWWFFSLLCTIVLAICVSAGLLLFFLVLDAHLRFSQGMLAGLFVDLAFRDGLFDVDRRPAAGAARSLARSDRPAGGKRISRTRLESDQPRAAFRRRGKRRFAVPRGRRGRSGGPSRARSPSMRPRKNNPAGDGCSTACKRRAIWPKRFCFLRLGGRGGHLLQSR